MELSGCDRDPKSVSSVWCSAHTAGEMEFTAGEMEYTNITLDRQLSVNSETMGTWQRERRVSRHSRLWGGGWGGVGDAVPCGSS